MVPGTGQPLAGSSLRAHDVLVLLWASLSWLGRAWNVFCPRPYPENDYTSTFQDTCGKSRPQ